MFKEEVALHNSEIEQLLLGGLLVEGENFHLLDLSADMFAASPHPEIYLAMDEIARSGKKIDRLTVSAKLMGTDVNFSNGDVKPIDAYLAELAYNVLVSSAQALGGYVDFLKILAAKRRIRDVAQRVLAGIAEMDVEQITGELSALILRNTRFDEILTEQQVHDQIVDGMSRPAKCYPTGLPDLDQAMSGGLFAGYTYGIGGAEKAGKTTFAHTISHNLAREGHKHLYVALEMGSTQIEQRNVSREIGVNSMRFIDRPQAIAAKVVNYSPTGCKFYYDAPGATLNDIVAKAKAAQIRHGITGFIVDYWQLVEGKDQRESEERHLRNVAQGLANFARKSGLWCLLLAQLNREGNLFGGSGLRKACDQLYFIETSEIVGQEQRRWLRMDASRYTPRQDIGHENHTPFELSRDVGPYIKNNDLFFTKGNRS